MSLNLALDCALGGLSFAINGKGLGAPISLHDATPRASDTLHTRLQEILRQYNLNLADVSVFITTIGPGSFTGIRIGQAVGEALKVLTPDLTLVGIGTLEACARQIAPQTQPFTILLDAAGQSLYHQSFAADGAPTGQPECVLLADFKPEGLIAAPASLMLPHPVDILLPPFDAAILLEMTAEPATHRPFSPLYVKPLTYKKQT